MTALNAEVLLLSKSWRPLKVISAKQALTLLYKDVVDAIDAHDYSQYDFSGWEEVSQYRDEFEPDKHRWVQSVRMRILVPVIVRLRDFDLKRKRKVRFSRRNIYARDHYRCQYCGKKFRSEELNLDHILPRSRGGKTTWENIVACCLSCNRHKDNRTPKEAKMPLLTDPKEPEVGSIVDVPVIRHESWKSFLDAAYWDVTLQP